MQVSSTLWPDIKSQKLSEHRFRLKWTKCSPRTQFRPLKIGQANRVKTKRRRTACWTKLGAVGPPGRSTDLLVGLPDPWAPPPQLRHVAPPYWLLKSVPGASAHGSLL